MSKQARGAHLARPYILRSPGKRGNTRAMQFGIASKPIQERFI